MENQLERRYISVPEVAVILNVSDYTIRRWRKRGLIPSLKIGGRVRFDLHEIEVWAKTKKSS